jgi:hypothetical protein
MIGRALTAAHVSHRRHGEFLDAYANGGLAAVARLNQQVADLMFVEVKYREHGVTLDIGGRRRDLVDAEGDD